MNGRWAVLGAAVLAGALLLGALARAPRRPAAPPPQPPPPPLEHDTLFVRDGTLEPAETAARLGHRLAVTVVHAGGPAVTLSLSGYEHAYPVRTLAAGETRTDTLRLDLPGEDFAWMLDGRPAAKLRVAGSHLAEGHR